MVRLFFLLTAFLSSMLVSGCIATLPQITGNQTGNVQQGTVLQVNVVQLSNQRAQMGITGTVAAIGGLLGNKLANKKSTGNRTIATLAGGAVGGVAGHVAGNQLSKTNGFEYIISLDKGRVTAISQSQDAGYMAPGTRVLLVRNGGQTRVVPSEFVKEEAGSPVNSATAANAASSSSVDTQFNWRKLGGSSSSTVK